MKALENAAPQSISLFYIGVFKDHVLVGGAVIQRVELYAKDMFRGTSDSKKSAVLKGWISSVLKGNILVIGNLTHTGQHGLYINTKEISQNAFLDTLFKAIVDLKVHIKEKHQKSIRAILFKDYFDEDAFHKLAGVLAGQQFHHVNVQPNMLLQVKPEWHRIEDYFNLLNKKYKTRYKRARKKLGNLSLRELNTDEVLHHSEHLYQLYLNVSNNASFNTFVLPKVHFYNYKRDLGDKFRLFAYDLDGEIIGFFSLILNYDGLETYFLGYDQVHQYDRQLYLNMLYDMISFGIEHQFKTIVFARTAMEIKSSVGSVPQAMSMYIKHTNPLVNALLRPIFKVMNTQQHWEERHPFKNGDNS